MKIFLIGMPGSGKTTLGQQLAERLMVPFVDLDVEIEKSEGKVISQIFSEQGEDNFRLIESRLLREWAGGSQSFVMATGGGAPCFHQGIETINKYGLSVFLDCPVSELVDRVRRNRDRPLLLAEGEEELRKRLEKMLDVRLSCYGNAHVTLKSPTLTDLLGAIRIRK